MRTDVTPRTGDWLPHDRRVPAAPVQLVCFPYAGGTSLIYLSWIDDMADLAEVLAVEPPGRGARIREPAMTSVAMIADAATQALLPRLDERPTVLFGHSLGALTAFAVAQRLVGAGREPAGLVVSGAVSPRHPVPGGAWHALSDEEFVSTVSRLSPRLALAFAEPELAELLLPMVRADFEAASTATYEEGPRLSCPIHAIRGDRDEGIDEAGTADWRLESSGEFACEVVSGGHDLLDSPATAAAVEAVVRTACRRAAMRGS